MKKLSEMSWDEICAYRGESGKEKSVSKGDHVMIEGLEYVVLDDAFIVMSPDNFSPFNHDIPANFNIGKNIVITKII